MALAIVGPVLGALGALVALFIAVVKGTWAVRGAISEVDDKTRKALGAMEKELRKDHRTLRKEQRQFREDITAQNREHFQSLSTLITAANGGAKKADEEQAN